MTLTASQIELLIGALSFFFTVALLSYLLGDNPLYRLALHIFIGVGVGYTVLVVIEQVIRPRLIAPINSGEPLVIAVATVPLILVIFLILKLDPRTSALGNIGVAFLVGVGAAVAMIGALLGTLLPHIQATWLSLLPGSISGIVNNAVIVIGTITTLIYFQFWVRKRAPGGQAKRGALMGIAAYVGQVFLMITLGAIYGSMILSGLAIFSERFTTLSEWISTFLR